MNGKPTVDLFVYTSNLETYDVKQIMATLHGYFIGYVIF